MPTPCPTIPPWCFPIQVRWTTSTESRSNLEGFTATFWLCTPCWWRKWIASWEDEYVLKVFKSASLQGLFCLFIWSPYLWCSTFNCASSKTLDCQQASCKKRDFCLHLCPDLLQLTGWNLEIGHHMTCVHDGVTPAQSMDMRYWVKKFYKDASDWNDSISRLARHGQWWRRWKNERVHPGKLTWNLKQWRLGNWFSFSTGWFLCSSRSF